MSFGKRFAPAAFLSLLAFAGLVAGHGLSYMVVAPDAYARQELLRATGHASHDLVITWSFAAAAAALIGIIACHLRSGWGSESRPRTIPRVAAPLWILQTIGFVLLEVTERSYALHHAEQLLQEPGFLLGIVAQAAVALAVSVLVYLLRATVDVIRRLLAPPARTGRCVQKTLRSVFVLTSSISRSAWNLRGPPISAGNQG